MIQLTAAAKPSEAMITELFRKIDLILDNFVIGIFEVINTTYGGAIFWAMTLYLVLYGIRLMMGNIQTPLMDAMRHIGLLVIAVFLATNVTFFQKNIYQTTTNTVTHLSGCLAAKATALSGVKTGARVNCNSKNAGVSTLDTFLNAGLKITGALFVKS